MEEFMDRLAQMLGESKEAWRGAEALADLTITMLDTVHGDEAQNIAGDFIDKMALVVLSAALVGVSLHPMANGLNEKYRREH
jgi:hypothetical protein